MARQTLNSDSGDALPRSLRVLLVEDSPTDVELIGLELERAGFEVISKRVETAAELRYALQRTAWDIVLTDHAMPRFDSFGVLEGLSESDLDTPCLVVSGAVGEETAVTLLQSGAVDLVHKDKLGRLGPAVKRALREAEGAHARREAEAALKRANDELEQQVETRTTELQKARLQLLRVREEERRAFAREVHDHALQGLLGVSYRLAETEKRLRRGEGGAPLAETLGALRGEVLEVAQGLRGLIRGLRPAGLEEFGLKVSLENYVSLLEQSAGVPEILCRLDDPPLPLRVSLCLLRVAQEALRNALKHAEAERIVVTLTGGDEVCLSIRDDGRGFRVPKRLSLLAHGDHFGLIGVEEQVSLVGGRLEVASAPDEGTRVSVWVGRAETGGT